MKLSDSDYLKLSRKAKRGELTPDEQDLYESEREARAAVSMELALQANKPVNNASVRFLVVIIRLGLFALYGVLAFVVCPAIFHRLYYSDVQRNLLLVIGVYVGLCLAFWAVFDLSLTAYCSAHDLRTDADVQIRNPILYNVLHGLKRVFAWVLGTTFIVAIVGSAYLGIVKPGRFHAELEPAIMEAHIPPTVDLSGTWSTTVKASEIPGYADTNAGDASVSEKLFINDLSVTVEASLNNFAMTVFSGNYKRPILKNGVAQFEAVSNTGETLTLQYKDGRIGIVTGSGAIIWCNYESDM